jgi:DNA-binding PadR family transcriptional regulator
MTRRSAVARRAGTEDLLLGEWACLGILYADPSHGFAVAARLQPETEVGRIWSMSRALTYRALEQLQQRDLVRTAGEEPGIAGGNRTIFRVTRAGRLSFRRWVNTPVVHLRDLRSELLLKLVLAAECGLDVRDMLESQRQLVDRMQSSLRVPGDCTDPVALWRFESAMAASRFLDRLTGGHS